jgi:hypothetical protein
VNNNMEQPEDTQGGTADESGAEKLEEVGSEERGTAASETGSEGGSVEDAPASGEEAGQTGEGDSGDAGDGGESAGDAGGEGGEGGSE